MRISSSAHHGLSRWRKRETRAREPGDRVGGRTRLAIGGIATVAASVAVVTLVAMTSTVALADAAGVPARTRPVVVPAAATTPAPAPTASAAASATQVAPPVAEPETVPAPGPEDVAAGSGASAGEPSPTTGDQLVAEPVASGSWDSARAWAAQHGWTSARIEAWIARHAAKLTEFEPEPGRDDASGGSEKRPSDPVDSKDSQTPARAGDTSGHDLSGSRSGSKREQSLVPPD